ncbi:MAG: TonB-dependent receptor [Pseudomonadota bacterium]
MRRNLMYAALMSFIGMLPATAVVADDEQAIEEVVVTGTYIKRQNQADLTSPLATVGIEDMEANGWTDLEDVAETLTYNPSSYGRSGLATGCCGTTRSIELRGLGVSSTLILLNGKRTASNASLAGNDFTNIKTLIPMIALDRMETLLDGGAALYGSDAVAGVVNFITRDDFEGLEIRSGGKEIEGSGQYEFQALMGGGNDRIHGVFAVGFEHVDHMKQAERPFTLRNNTSSFGSPGTYILNGRPTNGAGGSTVLNNGLNGDIDYTALWDQRIGEAAAAAAAAGDPFDPDAFSLTVADPYCRPDLVPSPGNGVPGGGQPTSAFPEGLCRFTYQPNNSITPEENTWMFYTHWDIELDEHTALEFESSMFRQESRTRFIGTFPLTNGAGQLIVPADHPSNPFNTELNWRGRPLGLAYDPATTDGESIGTRFALTLTGDFGSLSNADWAQNWTYSLSAQYSEAFDTGDRADTDLRLLQLALNGYGGPDCPLRFINGSFGPSDGLVPGSGACQYFSPFGADIYNDPLNPQSGLKQDPSVIEYNAKTESHSYTERTLRTIEGHVTGDIFELPGGPAGLAIGFQNRKEIREAARTNFQRGAWQGFLTPRLGGKGGRSVDAYFAELYLPVFDNLDVQLAVRSEDYGDVDSTDPKIGIKWNPIDEVALRASWGTSFRAPSLFHVVGEDRESSVTEIQDPIHPDEGPVGRGTFKTIIVSKNPNLEPEESENFNFGVSWIPELSGSQEFQLDLDYWTFEFENQISAENARGLVAEDPCGPNIVRDSLIPLPAGAPDLYYGSCSGTQGAILLINTGFFNAGTIETSGIDLKLRYSFDMGENSFVIRSDTSYVDEYEIQASADGPTIDGLGFYNNWNPGRAMPEVRSNMYFTWMRDRHTANVTVRYISDLFGDVFSFGERSNPQCDGGAGCPADRDVSAHVEVDVQYNYRFGSEQQYTFTVGAINLLDEEPPDLYFNSYIPEIHNPYLRQLYARMSASL